MRKGTHEFTSESVSEGHPDKVCDQISDAVVDLFLSQDSYARIACETLTTTNRIVLAGEVRGPESLVSAKGAVNIERIEKVARDVVRDIGYEQEGFHHSDAMIDVYLHGQSVDIAQGVDASGNKDEGAGDQGIMFGYACSETDVLMPAPIHYAHRILESLSVARRNHHADKLGPDAKSQVTLRYVDGKPNGAISVVVSTQHAEGVDTQEVREIVRPFVERALPDGWMCADEHFYVNPTGRFVIGGPDGDAGLTGRKIIVDTYGGASPHGGGAFSGKDPSKVDRSAAYVARWLAKNIVAAKLARSCLIQLSYAIGVAKPLSLYLDLEDAEVDSAALAACIGEVVDLSPRGIRERLLLSRPIYRPTATYGHFGREPTSDGGFSWEKLDLVDDLRSAFNV